MATNYDTTFDDLARQMRENFPITPRMKNRLHMLRLWLGLREGRSYPGSMLLAHKDCLDCSFRTAERIARRALAGDLHSLVYHGNHGRRLPGYLLVQRLAREAGRKVSATYIRRQMEEMGVRDIPAGRTVRRWLFELRHRPRRNASLTPFRTRK